MHSDVKPIKMTNKARRAATGLAVCFQQYCEGRDARNARKVAVWANRLAYRQRECGVELVPHELLERFVELANRGTLFQ
jgi:hypothetical protein